MLQYIRDWKMEDAPVVAETLNNKHIQDNLRDGIPYPYRVEHAEAYIQSVLSAPPNTIFAWAIQSEGKPIGSIGISRKENIHFRTAELGYYLAEPFWGKGIMTKAIGEACGFVFTHTDIIRIFAEPFSHNIASHRVLEKAGFTLEGVLRSNAVKNNQIIDMHMYARIKSV